MYTYKMDSKPGDMKGDGMMKMWHVIGEHK
jgi:predicted lipoprotein with Yx(FWY)xxD motif